MKSRALSILSFVVGIVLFIILIRSTGTAEIVNRVRSLGWGFLAVLAISMVRQFARTFAWLRCMSDDQRSTGFFAVWRARMAGDALSDLTAAGPIIGEPVKLARLKREGLQPGLTASLAAENLAYGISCFVLVAAGSATLLVFFARDTSMRSAGAIALGASVAGLIAVVTAIGRRWRLVSGLVGIALAMFGAKTGRLERLQALEEYVFQFFAQRQGDFWVVALCEVVFHVAGVLEIYGALYLIGSPATLVVAFVLEAVNRVINLVFAFVPALVGVDEAGSGFLANALGLGTPVGVSLALIRKARMVVWIAVGLVFLGRQKQ